MNIFFLNQDPIEAARAMCDKHIVKMPLETAQMLSTAHRVLDGTEEVRLTESGRKLKHWRLPDEREHTLYKAAYINHPSTVWARSSRITFNWLWQHGLALCAEYTKRYGKVHKCEAVIRDCSQQISLLPNYGEHPAPQCMPDKYRNDSLVTAYRNYYIGEKSRFAKWNKGTQAPSWWPHV